ncbi:MAG TPA: hypothetical protein VF269_04060 [Rhodanobacteraceae bacterium]
MQTVYAQVCLTQDHCEVWALRGSSKALVGKFDNVEAAVMRYAARHRTG